MDMYSQIMIQNYERLGFPIKVLPSDRSEEAIMTYPGWGAGFFVIDVDKQYNGLQTFKQLQKQFPFPKTWVAQSQRGGLHLYYAYPDGYIINSRVDTANGIDVLADDSRVTLPPTRGKISGNRYRWIHSPFSTPLAQPTPELLQFINAQKITHHVN